MKYITHILLFIIALLLCFCLVKGCESKPSDSEVKANASMVIDSIKMIETRKINFLYDSLLKEKKIEDSLHKAKISSISKDYNALRLILKGFKAIKVDSLSQKVNVPVIAYNASIEQGDICDSLLMYLDQELAIKDSIISYREIQLQAESNMNNAHQQALADQIQLNGENKVRLKRAKNLNKKIPTIAAIGALAGSIFTILILK